MSTSTEVGTGSVAGRISLSSTRLLGVYLVPYKYKLVISAGVKFAMMTLHY
ncbi:MAG: hypothetical protein JHC73_09905 [Dolichospermum sp.]|nr:hypothetical protein [Dolichospermum sp.]